VAELFAALYPNSSFDSVWMAFHDFERVFRGLDPNYHAVDTTYHDMQHTLDMTLALARLIAGHEMSVEPGDRLCRARSRDRQRVSRRRVLAAQGPRPRCRQRRRVHARARARSATT
jgi:hypothetical protein